MQDHTKTKQKLIEELVSLRRKVEELGRSKPSESTPAEQLIQANEAKYQRLFEIATIGIFQSSAEGKVITANPVFARMFGYESPADVIASIEDVATEIYEDHQRRSEIVHMILESPTLRNFENIYRRKDGSTFIGNLHIWPVQNADGSLLTIEGFVEDITERKRAEKALWESESKLKAMLQSIPDHMTMMDEELNIVWANKIATQMFGDGIIGRKCYESYHNRKEPCEPYPCLVLKTFNDGGVYEHNTDVVDKEGNTIHFHCTANVALRGKDDKPVTVLEISRDITARKRVEEDLERHQKYLEDMIKERTEELEGKNVTLQELNTTLKVLLKQREGDQKDMEERFVMNVRNLVLPYVEQMKKGNLNVGQRPYLDIIETHLHAIATPLLKNMRQFNFTPKEIKVAALVRQGRSTKEIAEILGIATASIDIHRKNVRKKLGLSNRRANLQSHLESLE